MKKMCLGLAFVLAISGVANANEHIKPYVGLDYVYSKADIDKIDGFNMFEDKFHSFSINAGSRLNRNFGVEGFYQKSSNESKSFANGKTDSEFSAFGVDGIGYMPLDCSDKIDLLGAFGIGYYDVDAKAMMTNPYWKHSDSEKGFGYRFALGSQYNFDKHWAVRGLGRYVWTDLDGIDGLYELSLGVRYTF